MVDFAVEHSLPLRSANRTPVGQSIHSKSNSFCFPYRWLQNMHRENYIHNSLGEYLFFSEIFLLSIFIIHPIIAQIGREIKFSAEILCLPFLR